MTGLPAILSGHELRLICELNLDDIEVIVRTGLCDRPTPANKLTYNTFRDGCVTDQQAQLRHNKVVESRKVVDKILAGKRKKMAQAGAAETEVMQLSVDQVLQDIYNECTFNEDNALLQVPTQHPFTAIGM